jgi:hypothetical protein
MNVRKLSGKRCIFIKSPVLDVDKMETFVSENERSVLKVKGHDPERTEILEFYVGSDNCHLHLLMDCGEHVVDSIKTAAVLTLMESGIYL